MGLSSNSAIYRRNWIYTVALTFLSAVCSPSSLAQCDGNTSETYKAGAIYTNPEYGFSVTVPRNTTGCVAKPPAPNHGIRIKPESGTSYLWVDGAFNASEFKSCEVVARRVIARIRREFPTATARSSKRTVLGGLPACSASISYQESGKDTGEKVLVALKKRGSEDIGMIYTVGFLAKEKDDRYLESVMEELLKTLHFNW